MNLVLATICVLLFSLTVPTTRLATQALSPETVAVYRLLGAGLLCLGVVLGVDRWLPPRRIWAALAATSFGSVWGFSLLIALALRQVPAAHGAVALAALPALTAGYSSVRDRVNPGFRFWLFCLAGTGLTLGFFVLRGHEGLRLGDGLLALAVMASAFGYVEGARLSREHGGRRIMSWAILLTLPFTLGAAWLLGSASLPGLAEAPQVWGAVLYLGLVSQSLGMFLWYRVLARGPMARIALVQLVQPFLSLLGARVLLGESPDPATWIVAAGVIACVFGANRARSKPVAAVARAAA